MRFGQKKSRVRQCARKGSHPRGPAALRYQNANIVRAILLEPRHRRRDHDAHGRYLGHAAHLDESARAVALGAYAVILMAGTRLAP